jgi:hypothetical protein
MMRKHLTPVNSPQKERYGDRFIPSRAGNNWQTNFSLIQVRALKVVSNEKEGGLGRVENVPYMSRTLAIKVYIKFEHTVFE